MTRSIQKIDGVGAVIELQHRGGDRNAPLFLQLHPVGGHLALFTTCFHRTGLLDGTPVKQEFFRERGFTRVGVGDDREIATTINGLSQGLQFR